MIKTIITLAVVLMIIAGTVSGCQSSARPEDEEIAKVLDAEQNWYSVQNGANTLQQKVVTTEEWVAFKNNSETNIRSNEMRIAELSVQLNKPGTTLDSLHVKRVKLLGQQNKDLQTRLASYNKSHTDWETFKREFNHDMDELAKALKDLTTSINK